MIVVTMMMTIITINCDNSNSNEKIVLRNADRHYSQADEVVNVKYPQ